MSHRDLKQYVKMIGGNPNASYDQLLEQLETFVEQEGGGLKEDLLTSILRGQEFDLSEERKQSLKTKLNDNDIKELERALASDEYKTQRRATLQRLIDAKEQERQPFIDALKAEVLRSLTRHEQSISEIKKEMDRFK